MHGNLYEGRLQTDNSPDNKHILKEGDIYAIFRISGPTKISVGTLFYYHRTTNIRKE